MKNKVIQLKVQYENSLNTREAAIDLCKKIESLDTNSVDLDFTGIEFMSRSFADQFYKERMKLRQNNISLFLTNTNQEIEKILNTVEKTQNKKDRSFNDIQVIRFKSVNEMSNFLLSR